MNVLAVYSIKGGVGKTSSAVNLAFNAAHNGYRTLVWDLDHREQLLLPHQTQDQRRQQRLRRETQLTT
jgi:cellulose biosynthesis protein BcsQ